ncbi:MAG TPA: hypothetical protein VGS20_05225 [Candidatus Acidoferrales bacterium]|nr:hypothetical protein [Candidatus Acidoferrales bacterium]
MAFHSPDIRRNQKLVGFLILVFSIYLAYLAGEWVLEGGIRGVALRIGEIGALCIALAVLVRWRTGVLLFLVWLTFEDLPRKYMGNDMRIYFLKDLLVAVVYGAFLVAVIKGREKLFRPGFWVPLVALISLGLAQCFNPRSTSIYYGLLGMKLDFYYVPLMFLGYSLLTDIEDLDRFLSFNLKVAGVVALVGIIQGLGWRNFLNPVALAPALQLLGDLVRVAPGSRVILQAPPSVFVSQGRYGNYLVLMFTLALGVLAFELFRHRRARKSTYLALGLLGVAVFLAGSKGAVMYALLTLAGFGVSLALGVRYQPWASARLGKILRRSVVALAITFCLVLAFFPNLMSSWGTYYYELLSPESPSSVLAFRTGAYPLSEFEKALEYADWTTGYGTGTASLGVQYVTTLLNAPEPAASPVENGYGDLIVEWGILGPILWMVMGAALVVSGWRVTRRLSATPLYPLALAILWFAFWLLFPLTWGSMTTYQNFVVNAYLWILVGVLFRLPGLVATREATMRFSAGEFQRRAVAVRGG